MYQKQGINFAVKHHDFNMNQNNCNHKFTLRICLTGPIRIIQVCFLTDGVLLTML